MGYEAGEAKEVFGMLQSQKFRLHKASQKTLSELPMDLEAGEREAIALASGGLITSVRREMDHLIEVGTWIDEKFYHRVLQEYGK